ncbi:MAG TPA: recombinase family protein [Candidatus Acidoferrum sp.]|nr:recombinase family protein [Candidatus Acidoferrum sp.]
MADTLLVSEYLRMSTEHQQYSLENQSASIHKYAETHGSTVVRTYSDPAKSGLFLKNRRGLRDLLQDVTGGNTEYKAILVYDVSRWGRFQDTDEAAHYEFLCKSAGVPIHYCAETFVNDGSLSSSIMKTLKRVMAGEYSRELGVKVIAGQKRLAALGFKQGGIPGYGFRRLLVSENRSPKQLLAQGEMKSISTDRVILVPGPAREIEEVREIFRKFTVDGMGFKAIARDLNQRGVPSIKNKRWTHSVVASLISHPKYIGCNVFNRTTMRLGSAPVTVPTSDWVICPGSHEAIVDTKTFALAQEIQGQTARKTNEQLLEGLRSLLAVKGKLSNKIIDESVEMLSSRTFAHRFGGLRRAFELIGYDWRKNGRKTDEEMLQHLRSLLASHGRLSVPIIDAAPRLVSSHKLRWRFGRLRRAYELIGYDWKKDLSKTRRKT